MMRNNLYSYSGFSKFSSYVKGNLLQKMIESTQDVVFL